MTFELQFSEALVLAKEENFEAAISAFNQALILSPGHVSALFNRGMAKFSLQRYHEAIVDFNTALENDPRNADIISQRGVAYHLMGNNQAAMQDFERTIQIEPENDYRYACRAYLRDKLGDTKGAVEDYRHALSIDPANAISHNNLGLLEQKLGFLKNAGKRFETADQLAEKSFGKVDAPEIRKKEAQRAAQWGAGNAKASTDHRRVGAAQNTKKPNYWKTAMEIFKSRKEFTEFIRYSKSFLRPKNSGQ